MDGVQIHRSAIEGKDEPGGRRSGQNIRPLALRLSPSGTRLARPHLTVLPPHPSGGGVGILATPCYTLRGAELRLTGPTNGFRRLSLVSKLDERKHRTVT